MLERILTTLVERAVAWLWRYLVNYGKRLPTVGLCDHGVPLDHRCYACEPRTTHGVGGNCPTCREFYRS